MDAPFYRPAPKAGLSFPGTPTMDPLTGLAIGSSVLSGIFGGIGAGKQAKESRLNREAEQRRWSVSDPLRQQLMQILMGKMGQPSPTAKGFDFFNDPRAGLPPSESGRGVPLGGGDPRAALQALLAAQRGRGR